VRITTSSAFGHRYVLPLLPGLVSKHPAVVPEVEFDDRRVDLVREGFDLALRGGVIEDSSLVSRHICDVHTLLIASPAYLKKHGVPRHPDELKAHRLIALRYLSGSTIRWRFKGFERMPEPPALVLSDPLAVVEAAVAGMGIAQAGAHHAWRHLQAGRLKSLLGRHHESGKLAMALQYPHRALMAPRVRVTVDYLLAGLAKNESLHVTPSQWREFSA
jgi:DNA-binding transcriptional LysR family regulator